MFVNVPSLIVRGFELSTFTKVRLEQYKKAELPIDVTLLGMVTEERLEQPRYLQLIVFQLILFKTVEK